MDKRTLPFPVFAHCPKRTYTKHFLHFTLTEKREIKRALGSEKEEEEKE